MFPLVSSDMTEDDIFNNDVYGAQSHLTSVQRKHTHASGRMAREEVRSEASMPMHKSDPSTSK